MGPCWGLPSFQCGCCFHLVGTAAEDCRIIGAAPEICRAHQKALSRTSGPVRSGPDSRLSRLRPAAARIGPSICLYINILPVEPVSHVSHAPFRAHQFLNNESPAGAADDAGPASSVEPAGASRPGKCERPCLWVNLSWSYSANAQRSHHPTWQKGRRPLMGKLSDVQPIMRAAGHDAVPSCQHSGARA